MIAQLYPGKKNYLKKTCSEDPLYPIFIEKGPRLLVSAYAPMVGPGVIQEAQLSNFPYVPLLFVVNVWQAHHEAYRDTPFVFLTVAPSCSQCSGCILLSLNAGGGISSGRRAG